MFWTRNLCEAHFNDLHRDLLFLRLLKSSSERIDLPTKYQFYSASHFSFFQPSFSEPWSNMNLFFVFAVETTSILSEIKKHTQILFDRISR